MRGRNGSARRVGGHPDRRHCVATRVEDVERPFIGCDGHIEGLVAHRNRREGRVGGGADGRDGVAGRRPSCHSG